MTTTKNTTVSPASTNLNHEDLFGRKSEYYVGDYVVVKGNERLQVGKVSHKGHLGTAGTHVYTVKWFTGTVARVLKKDEMRLATGAEAIKCMTETHEAGFLVGVTNEDAFDLLGAWCVGTTGLASFPTFAKVCKKVEVDHLDAGPYFSKVLNKVELSSKVPYRDLKVLLGHWCAVRRGHVDHNSYKANCKRRDADPVKMGLWSTEFVNHMLAGRHEASGKTPA